MQVCLTQDESHGRWILDSGEAGARLRVVVKEAATSLTPAFRSPASSSSDTVGHCYNLRPAPATDFAEVCRAPPPPPPPPPQREQEEGGEWDG